MHAVSMDMSLVGEGILSEMAVLVRDKAKGAIGTYRYGWPKLGPAAIANFVSDFAIRGLDDSTAE